jgi:uncharacterized protein (TIGR00251 family)
LIHATDAGVEIDVRVIPRAGKSAIAGERDGRMLIRVAAPPVEGAANDAIIELLAKLLDCPRRAVRIVSGENSRSKRLAVDGVTPDEVRRLLRA